MSFELIYTSARRGLRTGASGFCTVAATDGIPRALQDKLESLSGYRHTEAAFGHTAPVNHAHLTVRIQRKIYHVVSRIGDAGIDSTGRTNKIAHHLALSSSELSRFHEGPAALFADDQFWYEVWDSEPTLLEPNRTPKSRTIGSAGFDTWEQLFGDAGWAGVLGSAVADRMQSVSVIVPGAHAQDTLQLLNEALQLVPHERRWDVCFSTYYSRHVSGMQCHWRFVLDGTSEARRLRARVQGILVDPTVSASRPSDDNLFVRAAREGRPEQILKAENQTPPQKSRGNHERTESAESVWPDAEATMGRRGRGAFADDDDDSQPPVSGFGQRRRSRTPQPRTPPMTARSPFDIPEEEFSAERAESHNTDNGADNNFQEGGFELGSRRSALILVAVLSLALLSILVYFGIQQLS